LVYYFWIIKLNFILNNFNKLTFQITNKSNQKIISRYYLSILLRNVNNNDIISIIYGILREIISRHEKYYNNDGVIYIFLGMADNIINDYTNLNHKRFTEIIPENGLSIMK
jgi:hypothetical protein